MHCSHAYISEILGTVVKDPLITFVDLCCSHVYISEILCTAVMCISLRFYALQSCLYG